MNKFLNVKKCIDHNDKNQNKITIFNPTDYPDNTSGGVSDALISPGTENFLELDAVSFFSEKSVIDFDVDDRKCIFSNEISALYDGYTYSDCIVDCKETDVIKTCGCRPFYYPTRGIFYRWNRFCKFYIYPSLN